MASNVSDLALATTRRRAATHYDIAALPWRVVAEVGPDGDVDCHGDALARESDTSPSTSPVIMIRAPRRVARAMRGPYPREFAAARAFRGAMPGRKRAPPGGPGADATIEAGRRRRSVDRRALSARVRARRARGRAPRRPCRVPPRPRANVPRRRRGETPQAASAATVGIRSQCSEGGELEGPVEARAIAGSVRARRALAGGSGDAVPPR